MPWPKGKPVPFDVVERQKAGRRAHREAIGALPTTARASLSLTTTEVALLDRLFTALHDQDAAVVAECVSGAAFGAVRRVFERINSRNVGEHGFLKVRENGPKMPTAKRQKVYALRKAGATYDEITKREGISPMTAWRIVRELGGKAAE
jgi:hypothetical protein